MSKYLLLKKLTLTAIPSKISLIILLISVVFVFNKMLLWLLLILLHVLVSLENMKDVKFCERNRGITEHNATENQVLC